MKNVLKTVTLIILAACTAALFFMRKVQLDKEAADIKAAEEAAKAAELAAAMATPEPTPAPTPDPTPEPTPEPQPEYFTLSFIGDCTLWSNANYAEHPAGFKGMLNGDYSYPFANTVQYFKEDDYTIANLECILSDQQLAYDYTKVYFPFIAPKEYAKIMTEGGVDFVTTANNHIMDCYEAGANSTYQTLMEYGLPFGTEKQAQIVMTDSGLKLGIYCAGVDLLPNAEKAVEAIKYLQGEGAEYIICAFHWGQEAYYDLAASQTTVAQACAEAGADVVYGSHSHNLQKMEQIGDTLVLYSMGNWTFGGNTAPKDPDTAIVQVLVKRDLDGTISTDSHKIIPCCVSSKLEDAQIKALNYNDYKPTPYPEGTEAYARVLAKLSGEFQPTSQGADYSAWLASRSG
ncbi:MAG: CapA family protein [Oscillospiraceae bacterium]|nr:CapA family protein [Oscillospiraceae bacterium]